ncbi:alpha/beta fold hydrolase [Streptomyces sp. WAC05374]|uniref:alpha/beta fold hydrolase n=1 Tax=Streptomyces sp. WAC05374 TaxID=2487420 RepID=UPI000F888D6E|nr:alpha/beta fold hydrolase [Streptomyces sp. WAC05374]RST16530.1 alpha/beta fold hydrolase [Streptomyces sp. WAC05374]TDF54643.1 alpha/beta fold hydrolase [Streptomyces sp. WAC05374]TDF56279.1 alpha/beta fold hydrolase [Streptomyces sp. WAC05374]
MSRVTVNDATLHYDDRGPTDGTPVVLVHGHPFNRTLWAPQAEALATAGYRVVTPDLRGYGDSGVTPGKVFLSDFADDLAALADHLGIESAVIGGVSMGGQIAMDFRRRYPRRVRALVLSDTSADAETDEGKAFRNSLADRLLAEGMDGYAKEVIDKMLASYNVTALPGVAAQVLGMMRATDPRGAAAALRGRAERPDYNDTLAAVDVPTLIVVGADDAYTPVATAEAMHRLVPHATLSVIERAGHLPGAEQPQRFNQVLLDFLRTEVPAR